jgi:hypothetical protein
MSVTAILQQPEHVSLRIAFVPIVIFLVAVVFLLVFLFLIWLLSIWLLSKKDISGYCAISGSCAGALLVCFIHDQWYALCSCVTSLTRVDEC